MKCPYAVNRKVTTQSIMQYNEEGQQTGWTEYQNNQASFIDCLKEEYGAYNSETGRCEYKC